MQSGFLQADAENRGVVFDPRTKMLLLITRRYSSWEEPGRYSESVYAGVLCGPLYFASAGEKWKTSLRYGCVYTVAYVSFQYFGPRTTGIVNSLIGGAVVFFPVSCQYHDRQLSYTDHDGQ